MSSDNAFNVLIDRVGKRKASASEDKPEGSGSEEPTKKAETSGKRKPPAEEKPDAKTAAVETAEKAEAEETGGNAKRPRRHVAEKDQVVYLSNTAHRLLKLSDIKKNFFVKIDRRYILLSKWKSVP
jgi:hypothetical protein